MLVIKVEVWAGGLEQLAREIWRLEIFNTQKHKARPVWGDYRAIVRAMPEEADIKRYSDDPDNIIILDHKRDRGALVLLYKALGELLEEK